MNQNFIKKAIKLSKESFENGRFPAGAVLVKDNEIIGSGYSGLYPHIHIHAETRLIDQAMERFNKQLDDFELYTSMEPCLMCMSKAYWAGIKKITYVLSRADVDKNFAYETQHTTDEIISKLNRKIEFVQDKTFYEEALTIYKEWESKNKK